MTDDTETPTEGQLERDLLAAARERTHSALIVLLDKVAQRRRTGVRAVQYAVQLQCADGRKGLSHHDKRGRARHGSRGDLAVG